MYFNIKKEKIKAEKCLSLVNEIVNDCSYYAEKNRKDSPKNFHSSRKASILGEHVIDYPNHA